MIEQASLIIGNCNWANKEGSLLGYKLIDGKYYPREIDAVRATTATRVNSAGLVELVPYNLLQYSNTFSNSYWTKYQSSVTGGQSGYDGSTNAFLLADNGANDVHILQPNFTTSGQHTISIYAKANSLNWVWLRGVQNSANVRAWFNLSTGTIGTVETNGTANIESVGNGWYRCSLTIANHQSGFEFYYGVANANATTNYVGSGQSIFVQDAQLVEGSTAKDYLPTTDRLDIARIDYSTGSSALLAEPQRTNLTTYSTDITNADWVKAYLSITANAITSPNGTLTADKLIPSATPSVLKYTYNVATCLSGVAYTFSTYAKAGEYDKIRLEHGNNGQGVWFDLTNGTLYSNPFSFDTFIEDAGNGWWRCGFTLTSITTNIYAVIAFSDSANFTIGDGVKGGYLWGVQIEAGSYATSYIPTTSTSVTRNADVLSYSSLNSLDVTTTTNYTWFLDLGNDTIVNNFDIRLGGIGLYLIGTGSQGTQWSLYNFTALNQILSNTNITGNRKICLTYNSGVLKVFANNQLLTTYSGSITSDVLTFLMSNADNRLVLNTLAIFNTTLSDTDALNLIS